MTMRAPPEGPVVGGRGLAEGQAAVGRLDIPPFIELLQLIKEPIGKMQESHEWVSSLGHRVSPQYCTDQSQDPDAFLFKKTPTVLVVQVYLCPRLRCSCC